MRTVSIAIILNLIVSVIAAQQSPPAKPQAIYQPKPEYPIEARSRHLEGTGEFLVHVQRNGGVDSVEVGKSNCVSPSQRTCVANT